VSRFDGTLTLVDPVTAAATTVTLDAIPTDVRFGPDGSRLYAVVDGTLTVLDARDGTVLATVPVGGTSYEPRFSPDGSRILVTSYGGSATVIDTADHHVVAVIPVASNYAGSAEFTPDGSRALIPSYGVGATVTVVDPSDGSVIATVPVGDGPSPIRLAADGVHAWVASNTSDSVTVIDTRDGSVAATFALPSTGDVVFTPDGTRAVATDRNGGILTVIDTATLTVLGTADVGSGIGELRTSPDGAFLYVSGREAGTVTVVATADGSRVATIPVGQRPGTLSVSPDGGRLYVSDDWSGALTVIDTADLHVVTTVPDAQAWETSVAFSPDGAYGVVRGEGQLLVVSTADDTVTVVPVEGNGGASWFTPDGQYALAYDYRAGTVNAVWLPAPGGAGGGVTQT
jgi:YVTN family beta-propeller protein